MKIEIPAFPQRCGDQTNGEDAREPWSSAKVAFCETVVQAALRPSDSYSYTPLDSTLKQIRVLDVEPGAIEAPIRATLRHVSLLSTPTPQYESVSYAWGDPSLRAKVVLDGHEVDVPNSSEEALRNLRSRYETMTLWIDALCINQTDVNERNHQVALMESIYRNTSCTHVWLGDSDHLTSQAFMHLDSLLQQMLIETEDLSELDSLLFNELGVWVQANPPRRLTEEATIAVQGIFNRSWFSRIWVIQETSLPKECICHCGTFSRPMVDVLRVAVWIRHKFEYETNAECEKSIDNACTIWDRADHNYGRAATMGRTDFSFVLATCSKGFQASDPRDRIFGLLGLATLETDESCLAPLLAPDYGKTTEEVFRDATIFVMDENKSLWPLSFGWRRGLEYSWPFCKENPSWVPSWDGEHIGSRPSEPFRDAFFSAGGQLPQDFDMLGATALPGMLELPGVIVGCIQAVSRPWMEDDRSSTFPSFVEQCTSLAAGQSRYPDRKRRMSAIVRTLHGGATYDHASAFQRWHPDLEPQFSSTLSDLKECQDQSHMHTLASPILQACGGRRFFTTPKYFGLGPSHTEEGDIVCVLIGEHTPFIIRPFGQEYFLIGACYVDGIMSGELLEDVDASKARLKKIRLR